MRRTMLVLTLAALSAAPLAAQRAGIEDTIPVMQSLTLDGPRVGVLLISGPRAMQRVRDGNLQPFMSVFGWHFEQVTRPAGGGPSFLVQEVFVLAGLEQGTAIPSGTFLMGMRLQSGFEFGVGPNISPLGAALAMGIGKSLRYGGVTIPLNIGIVRSRGGLRTILMAGYAVRRK